MKNLYTMFLILLFSVCICGSTFAMEEKLNYGVVSETPQNEQKDENGEYSYIWTWLNDDLCVQLSATKKGSGSRDYLSHIYELGSISGWLENGELKKRDTYIGAWSQAEDGTWYFRFEDQTIPIELTKIDGVLYAFNGYGELMEGFEYWNGQETSADGVINCNDPEFLEWMKTQYIPECHTREAIEAKDITKEGPGD